MTVLLLSLDAHNHVDDYSGRSAVSSISEQINPLKRQSRVRVCVCVCAHLCTCVCVCKLCELLVSLWCNFCIFSKGSLSFKIGRVCVTGFYNLVNVQPRFNFSDEVNKVILNLGLMVLPVQNAKSFWWWQVWWLVQNEVTGTRWCLLLQNELMDTRWCLLLQNELTGTRWCLLLHCCCRINWQAPDGVCCCRMNWWTPDGVCWWTSDGVCCCRITDGHQMVFVVAEWTDGH